MVHDALTKAQQPPTLKISSEQVIIHITAQWRVSRKSHSRYFISYGTRCTLTQDDCWWWTKIKCLSVVVKSFFETVYGIAASTSHTYKLILKLLSYIIFIINILYLRNLNNSISLMCPNSWLEIVPYVVHFALKSWVQTGTVRVA